MSAVLVQGGVRALLLRASVDHHHNEGMAVQELFPGLLQFVQVVPEAKIQSGQ